MALRRFRRLCPVTALMVLASALASAQQPAPLEGPGPLERRSVAVTPENPIPKRVATTAALYPTDVSDRTVRGTVTLRITVDALGQVAEARQPYRPDPSMIPVGDGSVGDLEGQHGAEAGHLRGGGAVSGVAGKARVAHAADGRMLIEPAGEFGGVALAAIEAQGQGAQAAQRQEGFQGSGGCAGHAAAVADAPGEGRVAGDGDAG